jgi:hypothetical protein
MEGGRYSSVSVSWVLSLIWDMQPFLLAVKCICITSVCTDCAYSFCILHSEVIKVFFFKQTTCGSFYVFISDIYDSEIS